MQSISSGESPLGLPTFDHFLTGIYLSLEGTRACPFLGCIKKGLFLGGASLCLFSGAVLMIRLSLRKVRIIMFLQRTKLDFFLGGVSLEGLKHHHLLPRGGVRVHLAVARCRSHVFDSRQEIFGSEQQSHCCCLCCGDPGDGPMIVNGSELCICGLMIDCE